MPETKHENRSPRPRELPELIYEAPMIFFVWAIRPDGLTKSLLKGDRNANGISV
jgi:hypothetical protein